MLALNAGKDYLLAEVGVFWVLVRVLACGGLAAMVWLVTSGQWQTKRVTEVRSRLLCFMRVLSTSRLSGRWWECRHYCSSFGTQDCSRPCTDSLRPGMYPAHACLLELTYCSAILFTHFSPFWFKPLTTLSSVRICLFTRSRARPSLIGPIGQASLCGPPVPRLFISLGCSLPSSQLWRLPPCLCRSRC